MSIGKVHQRDSDTKFYIYKLEAQNVASCLHKTGNPLDSVQVVTDRALGRMKARTTARGHLAARDVCVVLLGVTCLRGNGYGGSAGDQTGQLSTFQGKKTPSTW